MNAALSSAALERAQRAVSEGSSLRVVGRARLPVDRADQAWAAQQALEDGLNTADFADCGRLIVVRSLQLRSLESGARGPAFARAIEAAWRALAPSALAFDAPAAASAPAVYFRSATAARLGWLQRVAESQAVDAWFWRSALPELTAAPSQRIGVALVLDRLLRDAPQALADALPRWPVPSLRRLFAALPSPLPTSWSRWPPAALRPAMVEARLAATRDAAARVDEADRSPAPQHTEAAAVVAWLAAIALPDEAQRAWLATLVLAPVDPSSLSLAGVAAVLVRAEALAASREIDADETLLADDAAARQVVHIDSPAAHLPERRAPRSMDNIAPSPEPAPQSLTELPSAARAPTADRITTERWPWLAGNAPTAHGGLLMLLNVLRSLDFDAWLATQAPADRQPLVAFLFETLADRLRVPPDDPHRVLFAAAEPVRHDAAARQSIGLWVRRLRRALRLHAHVGLASVVRRDAGIAITTTHIDVVLPLHSADLRLRRAGLDSDPGWLPWFGWIVKLHYVSAA